MLPHTGDDGFIVPLLVGVCLAAAVSAVAFYLKRREGKKADAMHDFR